MNVFEIIQRRQIQDRYRNEQQISQGVVVGYQQGEYLVTAGGITYLCQSGISDALKPGMRVYLVLGRGTTRIIGMMGSDINAA